MHANARNFIQMQGSEMAILQQYTANPLELPELGDFRESESQSLRLGAFKNRHIALRFRGEEQKQACLPVSNLCPSQFTIEENKAK